MTTVDGVNPRCDKRVSVGSLVCPRDKGSPVPEGFGAVSPDTGFGGSVARLVDVVFSRGGTPVGRTGDG